MSCVDVVQIICGILIWLVISPLLFPLLCLLALWKCLVLIWIRLFYPRGQILGMSLLDMTFKSASVSLVLVADGPLNLDRVKAQFNKVFLEKGHEFPVFHSIFVSIAGFSFRKVVSLELDEHFREETWNPEQESENDAYFRVGRNDDFLLREEKPPWEIVLLHNAQDGKSTLFFKMSHGLVDSYSIRRLIDTLVQNKGSYKVTRDAVEIGVGRKVLVFLKSPLLLGKVIWEVLKNRRSVTLQPSLPLETYWSKGTVDGSKIREISAKTGVRISPILMYLQIRALTNVATDLSKKDKSAEGWDDGEMITIYPIPAPNHPADRGHFCNHVATCILTLPLLGSDPLSHLKAIQDKLEHFEKSETGRAGALLTVLMSPILPDVSLFQTKSQSCGRLFASLNMLNPLIYSKEYTLTDVRITNLFFVLPPERGNESSTILDNFRHSVQSIILTPFSHGDEIDLSVHIHSDMFSSSSEADLYLSSFQNELALLEKDVNREYYNKGNKSQNIVVNLEQS